MTKYEKVTRLKNVCIYFIKKKCLPYDFNYNEKKIVFIFFRT